MQQPLLPAHAYHIYNRGNNKQPIFFNEDNYRYFLRKYRQYMDGYWHTLAYALMGNHFHLVVRVRSEAELIKNGSEDFKRVSKGLITRLNKDFLSFKNLESLSRNPSFQNLVNLPLNPDLRSQILAWAISERFRRFLMGYSKAINKQQDRTGSLFQKNYKRKELESRENIRRAMCYVHHNPIHHGFAIDYDQYEWCSYLSNRSSYSTASIQKSRELFTSKEEFITAHDRYKSKKEDYIFNDLENQDQA